MRLLFKQRFFSWFSSYDIYDEVNNPVFSVEGKLALGHKLEIYDMARNHIGTVREEIFSLIPRFAMYAGDSYIGCIRKRFTLFKPVFELDMQGFLVEGDFLQWDYTVKDQSGAILSRVSKQLLRLTDTYTIDVYNPQNALIALMIVLAIDAAKARKKR